MTTAGECCRRLLLLQRQEGKDRPKNGQRHLRLAFPQGEQAEEDQAEG